MNPGFDLVVRNGLVVTYHAERLQSAKRITYLWQGRWKGDGPDWFLVHRFEGQAPPPPGFADPTGNVYRLESEYPSAPLSGWRWYLFRRAGRVAPARD